MDAQFALVPTDWIKNLLFGRLLRASFFLITGKNRYFTSDKRHEQITSLHRLNIRYRSLYFIELREKSVNGYLDKTFANMPF